MNTITKHIVSAGAIKGQKIGNLKGEKLGHIEDVMLDLDHSRISYVVLSFGGFLGIGDKLFAVPLDALTPAAKNNRFSMNVTKEQLKDAPGFDKNNWPTTADNEFLSGVYRHYSAKPYWQ